MPYGFRLEDLLVILHERAPAKAEALALQRRRVEHGLLSVGLKIHCLDNGSQFLPLVDRLGGPSRVLEINMFKHSQASLCLVLPPVGNARSAILLLECIEHFTRSALFANRNIQLQVCSPGRLDARPSALLAMGFYLGSDTLRRYAMGDLETTLSRSPRYEREQRLVIYDARGEFERDFHWWEIYRKHRRIRPRLPFKHGRTDLLIGSGSRLDIENINLLATLLTHAEHRGYWGQLGTQFAEEVESLLHRHLLGGLLNAPWVQSDDAESADDMSFFSALQELVAYALEESVRIKEMSGILLSRSRDSKSSGGILYEMQSLLKKYRSELVRQSDLLDKGART